MLMQWKVTLSDVSFDEQEEKSVLEVMRSKWLSMGEKTQLFEKAFAQFTGAKYAFVVSNCTAALHLAHHAMGAKAGDEIILPSMTFVATANTVLNTGATPVFADIDSLDCWHISAKTFESLVTPKTVGVVVMHYGGYPVNMTDIVNLCKKRNLYLIEDCAHSPGAYFDNKHTGRFGKFGCFSFFANKNLVTGEGGMLITDDDALAEKVRLLRSHGMTTMTWQRHKGHASSYDVIIPGFNYRSDEIHSAIGLVQLSKLEKANQRRGEIVLRYRELLKNVPDISIPFARCSGKSSFHLFPILLDEQVDRDMVMSGMRNAGIQTSIHYPAIHLFSYFKSHLNTKQGSLPLTEKVAQRVVTLPLYAELNDDQIKYVADTLQKLLKK